MSKLRVLPSDDGLRVQCPSAHPAMPGSRILGVVLGSVESPRVTFLEEPVPTSTALLALAEPVAPTEVFRFAAPCAARACQHFDGARCRLATRIVERLPVAVDALPDCAIRPDCRWWRQEGEAACRRCPLVVTESHGVAELSDELRVAADPATPVNAALPTT
jgi:hypothetical protein